MHRKAFRSVPARSLAVLGVVAAVVVSGCALAVVNETTVAWTNDQRDRVGATALTSDALLVGCAQQWADELARRSTLDHDPDLGACLPEGNTAVGENLARGSNLGAALDAVLESPAHFENMTSEGWDSFGFASARLPDGGLVFVWRFAG